jgi:hypothetical protein
MKREHQPTAAFVIGPLGTPLTMADLPSARPARWNPIRKAEIVAAVRGGLLSREEAVNRYALSLEELLGWERSVERYGLGGLRTTKLTVYRAMDERKRGTGPLSKHP